MDQATLDGCLAKVDGAEKQLLLLADEWGRWLADDSYPAWVAREADTGRYSLYFDFSIPPPPRFSVIAGEIAHDLRSALDHLAWREAVGHVGLQKADANARQIMFPLENDAATFDHAPALDYVSMDARALMERHQPYQRRDDEWPLALGLLHWLNRIDKHRALHPILVQPMPFQRPLALIDWNPTARMIEQPTWEISVGQPVEGKTKIASYAFDPDGPDPEVRVKGAPHFYVGFGEVPGSYRTITIQQTIHQVGRVIDDFASLLP